jgi:hypothetical protein
MRRKLNSLGAILVASVSATAIAQASPGGVYSDFAQDGVLGCTHSRADLNAVLRSGSLDQYGDPYTLTRLKLEVRRQLAGGCRSHGSAEPAGGPAASTKGTGTSLPSSRVNRAKHAKSERDKQRSRPSSGLSAAPSGVANDGNAGFVFKRAFIAALLLCGLGVGGWLARRALASGD